MSHRHGVVCHVTMERPVARHSGKLDIAHLAHRYQFGHFPTPLLARPPSRVGPGDIKFDTVKMDGMVPHRQVPDPDPHPFSGAGDKVLDRGKHL